MPHQSHTTSLGSCAKEYDPELPILDLLDVLLRSTPCRLADRALVVFRRCQADLTCSVDLNLVAVVDSNAWLLGWAVNTGRTMSAFLEPETRKIAYARHFRAIESASSSTFLAGASSPRIAVFLNTTGTMSSSDHNRAHRNGAAESRSAVTPVPSSLQTWSLRYLARLERI